MPAPVSLLGRAAQLPLAILAASIVAVTIGLAACGPVPSARLDVAPEPVQLDSAFPVREIVISNAGAPFSLLRWQANADSPLVRVSPSAGEVRAGGPAQSIRVSIDFSGLEAGTVAEASITVASNGGRASVPVHFRMSASRYCADGGQETYRTLEESDFPPAGSFVPGELLIGYEESYLSGTTSNLEPAGTAAHPNRAGTPADPARLAALAEVVRADHGVRLLGTAAAAGYERVATTDPLRSAERLERDPRVAFAHPNYWVRPAGLPGDPCFADQWNLHGFGVPEAWAASGDNRVVVAVIDTGVDIDHEDLHGKSLPGIDLWDGDDDPRPGSPNSSSAHGTHVAGIALARGDNGVGVAGVAYGANVLLLPVKIFDDSGVYATTAALADAILWSAGIPVPGLPHNPHRADVINMSLGAGPQRIAVLDRAARRARGAGSLLVAAAGNNGSTDGRYGIQSPANSPSVIAVGSVDDSLARSSFSDWADSGDSVDMMAPGGYGPSRCRRVPSTVPWSNYSCMAGTSMASPFVAGVAALMLSREGGLDPDQLEDRLRRSTFFDSTFMTVSEYGNGVLCADRAVGVASARRSTPCGSP